jgi:photosystem II stability/assembly factor-like uncharacterized protein
MATLAGLMVSKDLGANWTTYTTANGLASTNVNRVAVDGQSIYALTPEGLSISKDRGTSWSTVTTANGLVDNFVTSIAFDGSSIYAGVGRNSLEVSKDGGTTWNSLSSIGKYIYTITVKSGAIYVGGDNGLSISRDGGSNWTTYPFSYNFPFGVRDSPVWRVAVNGRKICVASESGVYVSADNGETWTHPTNGIPAISFYSAGYIGDTLYAGKIGALFRSTDGGANWTQVDVGTFVNNFTIDGDVILIGGINEQAAVSRDKGSTWTVLKLPVGTTQCLGTAIGY